MGATGTPGWACEGTAGRPAGGSSDGLRAVPRIACRRLQGGLQAAPGPGASGVVAGGPKLAYGARVGAARRAPGGSGGAPAGWTCGAPWMGLRAALWEVLAGGILAGPRARTPVR
jgi:hypothetical protein